MKVAVVGHVEWVEFARVPRVPEAGEIIHAQEVWAEPAGGGAVAAVQLARLGGACTFYTALGYAKLGSVPETEFGSLTMLQLPDDPFVSLELVHDPARPVNDIGAVNHLVIQVDDLTATIADLATRGVTADPPAELGPGFLTSWLTDPDGYRIELVQWPAGHPAGMTAADFA